MTVKRSNWKANIKRGRSFDLLCLLKHWWIRPISFVKRKAFWIRIIFNRSKGLVGEM